MKKIVFTFLIIILFNFKVYGIDINSDAVILDVISQAKPIGQNLLMNGKNGYKAKLSNGNIDEISLNIKKDISTLDKLEETLSNIYNNNSLPNITKRNALIASMAIRYYKLGYQDLLFVLNSTDNEKIAVRLNRCLYCQYIGDIRLYWIENQLKSNKTN